MENKMKNKNDKSDENSLGILNMDNLKVFGESSDHTNSTNSSNNTSRSSRVHERLKAERLKALETLDKIHKLDKKPTKSHMTANKENMKIPSNGTTIATPTPNKSQRLNQTEYVSQRRIANINISDLMTDETIHLENSSAGSRATSSGSKISFEPTEITGRSTLYQSELKMPRSASGTECRLSVSEILASSFAPKTRQLGELLSSTETTARNGIDNVSRRGSAASSSFTSFNGKLSLPRTADLSTRTCSELSMEGCGGGFSFAQTAENGNLSEFGSDEFAPGELMQSRLLLDEIAWAEEFAAIPNAALSDQAKSKVEVTTCGDFTSNCSSMYACDSDFSMGKFFNMRSDNIRDIVQVQSPDKCRTPVALVDSDADATPKVDNKTYSKVTDSHMKASAIAAAATTATIETINHFDKHESKDSGHESHTSYMLSMSAIDRALKNLDLHTDDSEAGVVKMFLSQAMTTKPIKSPVRDVPLKEVIAEQTNQHVADPFESIAELLLENKENLDPEAIRAAAQFSDTKSFTDSLLNASDMKYLDRSRPSLPRSPLSPLQIPQQPPEIKVSEIDVENEADIDEWPSTPIKSPHRRVRRSKSPAKQLHADKSSLSPCGKAPVTKTSPQHKHTRTPSPVQIVVKNMESRTPTKNVKPPTVVVVSAAPPKPTMKSLSSTRLESDKSDDFGVSPNLSHATNMNGDGGSTNTTPRTHTRKDATTVTTITPVSSPRSCISCTSEDYHSPQLDTSFRSEGRCLHAAGVRNAGNSPVSSEPGTRYRYANERKVNAGVPNRSCSYNSLKSAGPTSVRSTSRCSNSSEFSHRDGKVIPLKVTTLELSWSSTKLRKNARKSMQVKNTADKRLVLRIEVSGPGFELINAHGKTLSLQSQECRSIVINFCPTVTGPANGSLAFYAPQDSSASCHAPLLEIPLNGYGGNASITTQNISVSPAGSAFLTMGQLYELSAPLERSFKIHNRGPLQGFAMVVLDSNGLNLSRLCDAFSVQPQQFLLAPGETITVRVMFRPRRDDIRKIVKKIRKVITVANMRIISGDEANRQRIRRLLQRMSPEERAKLSGTTLDQLWARFPNEVDHNWELQHFKEQPSVAFDLVGAQQVHEIALTLNNERLDETSETSSLYDGDETVLFHTVCAASPSPQHMLYPVDEEHSAVDERVEGTWSVQPPVLQFDFREERGGAVRICNDYKSPQYFEVTCSHKHWLTFTPSEGYVQPDGGHMEILVHPQLQLPPRAISRDEQILIIVSMENERITVPVKLPHNSASH